MAEVVGPGGVDGIPPHLFKFVWWQTMRWSDGREWVLLPGEDYPSWMTYEDLTKRLLRNAGRQQRQLVIWKDEQDQVHLIMRPYRK